MDDLEAHIKRAPVKPLYHYTSASGLIGIFKSKALWATSHLHLNDRKEYRVAERLLSTEAEKARFSINQRRVFTALVRKAQQTSFVLSFSERSDRLSQWRAYCPGGNGYSVGFAPSHTIFMVAKSKAFNLIRCVYDEDHQRELAKELVARFVGEYIFTKLPDDVNESIRAFDRYQWWYSLLVISAAFKHQGFAEEREWRLVSQYPEKLISDLEYRSGRFGVTPYFSLPVTRDQESIRFDEIVVGPNANRTAARSAMDFLLHTYNCEATAIKLSRTPLRQ